MHAKQGLLSDGDVFGGRDEPAPETRLWFLSNAGESNVVRDVKHAAYKANSDFADICRSTTSALGHPHHVPDVVSEKM